MTFEEPTVMVSLIVDSPLGPAARHGLRKLRLALQQQGVSCEEMGAAETARGRVLLIVGTGKAHLVHRSLCSQGMMVPEAAESVLIRRTIWQGRETVVISGGDDRGLMYALLDVADRVGWGATPDQPLFHIRDAEERPEVAERALSVYTMQRAHFEERFFNQDYWSRYLDMLAGNRFNTFALLFAYESSGYFAPPYPYFFAVEEFPEVRVAGYTPEVQQRHLQALNRLVAMTHERGMDFTLGIWDHIYRSGVQGNPDQEHDTGLPWRVSGLTQENLMAYSAAALRKLLVLAPSLDAIQFRMHGESGLTEAEMDLFWEEIYDIMLEHGRGIRFDARAKGFPDHLIDMALRKGVPIRICTKYWMEQMGLPFHPTHVHPQNQMDRRHSYADLLRYPQRYKMHWRLWNGGTTRVLLWGDPDYVRRFAESTHLYDGEGFDVNEPLATKMAAQAHDRRPFALLETQYRSYTWEFERYWHFYQLFGRLGYNPQTPAEVWERAFERRFGPAAPHVQRGLHLASKILPRIVAYTYPYNLFPTTRGWVEKQRMGDLPDYARALPSDTQQFLSIAEEARCLVEGTPSAKVRPQASSAWFERIAQAVLQSVDRARASVGAWEGPEYASTIVDLRILAQLALYHARRIRAGVQWALFQHTRDLYAYDGAIAQEREAIEAWRGLVEAAADAYNTNLMMGRTDAGLSGHWRDELAALHDGLERLQMQRAALGEQYRSGDPFIAHVPVRRARPGEGISIRTTIAGPIDPTRVEVRYSTPWGDRVRPLQAGGPCLWQGAIPALDVAEGLAYVISAVDQGGRHWAWPAGEGPLAVTITSDDRSPVVTHQPVRWAKAGWPLTISARVNDPSGVAWVRLRYRSVTQYQDFRSLEMLPSGEVDMYQATIPAEHVDAAWDLMYLIEVMDGVGNGAIYPDLEVETPYIVVRLDRA